MAQSTSDVSTASKRAYWMGAIENTVEKIRYEQAGILDFSPLGCRDSTLPFRGRLFTVDLPSMNGERPDQFNLIYDSNDSYIGQDPAHCKYSTLLNPLEMLRAVELCHLLKDPGDKGSDQKAKCWKLPLLKSSCEPI